MPEDQPHGPGNPVQPLQRNFRHSLKHVSPGIHHRDRDILLEFSGKRQVLGSPFLIVMPQDVGDHIRMDRYSVMGFFSSPVFMSEHQGDEHGQQQECSHGCMIIPLQYWSLFMSFLFCHSGQPVLSDGGIHLVHQGLIR